MILNKNNFYKHMFFKFIILFENVKLMDFQFFSGHFLEGKIEIYWYC